MQIDTIGKCERCGGSNYLGHPCLGEAVNTMNSCFLHGPYVGGECGACRLTVENIERNHESAEVERLSHRVATLERQYGEMGTVAETAVARAEAVESKLSQLQLSNEVIVPLDDFKMARQWVLGAKCVCGKRKGWMHAFCDGCYSKLVPETKSNIYRMFRRKFVKLYVEILREKLANGGQQ